MESLGKYRIDGLIAEGGMAKIYRAKTEGVGGVEKTVAIKCLKGLLDEDDPLVKMLLDEARITVRMTHKNISQVYGLEHDGNTYFLVMELVDGINLADLCRYLADINRVFPVEAAVFIAMEVCSGLSYAHRMVDDNDKPIGIVHRDVTPQNICISKEGEVKLIDFGIAKAKLNTEETKVGTIKGKLNYMSPEQARGEHIDQRTDVFALGAVLYEMLSGHMLYPLSLDNFKLMTKTRMADFVPIESYVPSLPEKLRKIIAKALTRDINQRFATSRDFFLALSQFFHDECKVYDSMNLSMLVERCIEHKANAKKKASEEPKKGRPVKGSEGIFPDTAAIVSPNDDSDFSMESSDTAIINAADVRNFVSNPPPSDEITKPKQIPQQSADGLGVSSICRSVDLDIDNKAASEPTMMVKLDDVQRQSIDFGELFGTIRDKVMSMNEKTLVMIALLLTAILTISIIIFAMDGTISDDVQTEQTTDTDNQSEQTPDTDNQ